MVCLRHYHSWGKYWKQRRPCQYLIHHGERKAIKNPDVVNVNMPKEISKLHGVFVPIGSQVCKSFLSLQHMQVDLKRFEVNDFLIFNFSNHTPLQIYRRSVTLDSIFFDTVKFCAFFFMIKGDQFELQILSRC